MLRVPRFIRINSLNRAPPRTWRGPPSPRRREAPVSPFFRRLGYDEATRMRPARLGCDQRDSDTKSRRSGFKSGAGTAVPDSPSESQGASPPARQAAPAAPRARRHDSEAPLPAAGNPTRMPSCGRKSAPRARRAPATGHRMVANAVGEDDHRNTLNHSVLLNTPPHWQARTLSLPGRPYNAI